MLIGLHGRKQAGKDTVHARIFQTCGHERVERVSFADLLYRSAAAALGVTVETLQDLKTRPATVEVRSGKNIARRITVREYLQRYGTEAHRDVFGPDFWVDNVDLEHAGRIVVVTDVRFENEARAVRQAGGVVVRVVGPTEVENAGDGHASEVPLPGELVDDLIDNSTRDDNFRSLDEQVIRLVRRTHERTT